MVNSKNTFAIMFLGVNWKMGPDCDLVHCIFVLLSTLEDFCSHDLHLVFFDYSSFFCLNIKKYFILEYSMLLGEETSRNHQAYRRGHLDVTIFSNSVQC